MFIFFFTVLRIKLVELFQITYMVNCGEKYCCRSLFNVGLRGDIRFPFAIKLCQKLRIFWREIKTHDRVID